MTTATSSTPPLAPPAPKRPSPAKGGIPTPRSLRTRRVLGWIAEHAVGCQAVADGVAPQRSDEQIAERIAQVRWTPEYPA